MKITNLNLQEMRKKEGKKSVLKMWAGTGSSGNNNNNDNLLHFSVIMLPQIGEGSSFSVGDFWPVNIDGVESFYRVISVEDIIIPAGRYRCNKICEEIKGRRINYYWFVSGIGIVKWEIEGVKGALQSLSYEKAL